MPAHGLTNSLRKRHTDQRRDRQPQVHDGDCLASLTRLGQRHRNQRRHPEESTMRNTGDKPGCYQEGVVRGKNTQTIADGKRPHQQKEEPPTWDFAGQCGDQRCSDDDAHRVGCDNPSGGTVGNAVVSADVLQQPHGDELRGTDAEPADGERDQGEQGTSGPHFCLPRDRFALWHALHDDLLTAVIGVA